MDHKMKTAIIIYTFRGDAACLGACLASLDRLRAQGHDLAVLVADDARNPLPYPPAGVDYIRTDFERRGNLNGRVCVAGMLSLMHAHAVQSGADCLVKLDCDTVINSLDWIDLTQTMSGWQLAPDKDYCSGMCYAIRAEALEDIHAWAVAHNNLLAYNVPEDIGMGLVCHAVDGGMRLHQVYEDGKRACGYIYNGQPDESGAVVERPAWGAYESMEVVTFGNRNYIHASVPDKRDYASCVMRAYLDYLGAKESRLLQE